MGSLKGKVAIVTGASSGIGRAAALLFAREGAKVAAADVDADKGAQVAREIEKQGGTAFFSKCDVSKDSDVRALVARTLETFGGLDCAFNNAGIEGTPAPTQDCTDENFDRTIAINLKGVWLCMRHEIPAMLKRGGGSIVNCSSIAGLIGFPGIPAYVASKHAVIGLTRTAALELAHSKIRVNAVCPGVIDTPMVERFTHGEAQIRKQLMDGEPVGRMGSPEEIASAALWLCSDASSFVTGHPLVVDGGWVAQ